MMEFCGGDSTVEEQACGGGVAEGKDEEAMLDGGEVWGCTI